MATLSVDCRRWSVGETIATRGRSVRSMMMMFVWERSGDGGSLVVDGRDVVVEVTLFYVRDESDIGGGEESSWRPFERYD